MIPLFGQAVVQGMVYGSIYAIAAIGFGLVYHTTRVFHIAYGSIMALATYVIVTLSTGMPAIATPAAGLVGAIVAVGITLAVYRGIYVVLEDRGASSMVLFTASLGAAMAIEAMILMLFGAAVQNFNAPTLLRMHFVGGIGVSALGLFTVLTGVALLIVILWLMNRTQWGFQVRAVASNRPLAEGIGIRPRRVIVVVYAIAAVVSAIAGLLLGLTTSVVASMGTNLSLMAAIAVLIGGTQSYLGAYVAGVALGIVQAVAAALLPGEWSISAVFGAFLVVILLRPRGLFGASDA